ncbi:MAG: hypothetical protein ACLTA1_04275 [Clostridia bacterium]
MPAGEEAERPSRRAKSKKAGQPHEEEGLKMPAGEEAERSSRRAKSKRAGLNHGERHCHTILI